VAITLTKVFLGVTPNNPAQAGNTDANTLFNAFSNVNTTFDEIKDKFDIHEVDPDIHFLKSALTHDGLFGVTPPVKSHGDLDTHLDIGGATSNIHFQVSAIDHAQMLGSSIGTNTHAQIDNHIAGLAEHRLIDDAGVPSATTLWSSSKINTLIQGAAELSLINELVFPYATLADYRYDAEGSLDFVYTTYNGFDYIQTMVYTAGILTSIIGTRNTLGTVDTHGAALDTWTKTLTYNTDDVLDRETDWIKS
jgi:hypothetical protein